MEFGSMIVLWKVDPLTVGRVATVAWRRHSKDGEGSLGFGVDVSLLGERVMRLLANVPFAAHQSKVLLQFDFWNICVNKSNSVALLSTI